MLKKRLVGVVTIKNGWAVQSFGYDRYLPLGKPECLVENLDRWGADEILVQVIDRSVVAKSPDYELLNKLAQLGIGTPLIYSGGVNTIEDGIRVIQSGADRIVVDSLLHDDLSIVDGLSNQLGAQAIIASIPVKMGRYGPEWLDYRTKLSTQLTKELVDCIAKGAISEILLIDWRHEGAPGRFDSELVHQFPVNNVPLIAFGGVSDIAQMSELFSHPNISAVAIGNFLNYRENSIQRIKEDLDSPILRPPNYAAESTLLNNV